MMDTEVLIAECKMKPDGFWFRRLPSFLVLIKIWNWAYMLSAR